MKRLNKKKLGPGEACKLLTLSLYRNWETSDAPTCSCTSTHELNISVQKKESLENSKLSVYKTILGRLLL